MQGLLAFLQDRSRHDLQVIQSTQVHTEDEMALSRYLDQLVGEEWLKEGTELDVPKFMR